jgi:hypothetical protein
LTTAQIQARAKAQSMAKGLAVTVTKDGTTSTVSFQTRAAYESFINRALYQGYILEATV